MERSLKWIVLAVGLAAAEAGAARAQSAPRQSAPVSNYQAASAYQRSGGAHNAALNFYGRPKSMAYAPQQRAMPLPPPRPARVAQAIKPFSGVQQASSISPYLALDNFETQTSLPNYFMFVKPQLDQQTRMRAMNAQQWRNQQQMNAAAASSAAGYPVSDGAGTGHATQFMNNGGYYPGLR